jgi:hypothetical protein|uniref:hypothetical protein n=1 Tax=Prevotella sp. TaxID=59823 RepID=UPI0025DBA9E0
MEHFKRFDDQKLDSLRARYRGDDLFRTWARPLCRLEEQLGELNAVEVWSETEMLRQRLADVKAHPDAEAEFMYGQLISRHQSERTVIIILTVLFTQMADAAPDEEEDAAERNPNRAVCNVLAHVLMTPKHRAFALKLINVFRHRRYDNEGRKIVLPVTNYMDVRSPLQLMDDAAKANVETCVGEILERTQGVRRMLAVAWNVYTVIWRNICAIQEVGLLIGKNEPRNNSWGKNLKLVANVLGMMRGIKCGERMLIDGSVSAVSDVLGSNMRSYISKHADFGSSNTPLTKELHTRIKQLIEMKVADGADRG